MITPELQTFLESGVSILAASRDARGRPACQRVFGARVAGGGREVVVFLPQATGATMLANLRDNGRIAVCFGRPADHYSLQVKGRVVELAPAAESDRAWIDRHRHGLADSLAFVGLPEATTLRLTYWPCTAARLQVEHVFVQTPGPRAGEPLAGQGSGR